MLCWFESLHSKWRIIGFADRVSDPKFLELHSRSSLNSRFIHWLQDVPDQSAIVRQYCRYTGEIKTGRNIKQMVRRALEFATSDPKGPAYLMAAREVLEEVNFPIPEQYELD